MKKKLNVKLTACLVSLFIGLILLILGNKNKYCLAFGFIVLAFGVVLYVLFKQDKLNELLNEVKLQKEETEDTIAKNEEEQKQKDYILKELKKIKAKTEKQKGRLQVVFYLCAFLLLLAGIFAFV